MSSIIEHFKDLQRHPQPWRLQILELLHALMSLHREALKTMGNESLIAISELVSGEKDPRNLMVIVSVLKVIMVEWDISDHAEVSSPRRGREPWLMSFRCFLTLFSVTFQSLSNRHQTIHMGYQRKTLKAG